MHGPRKDELAVCLLVALRALCGCIRLAGSSFLLVAINAKARLSGRIMECSLQLRLHGSRSRLGVAVRALLVRGSHRLFRLRSVMAGVTLYRRMLRMLELYAAHRSALQHDGCCWRFLLSQNIDGRHADYGQTKEHSKNTSRVLHVASK